jgi:inhibitor of KinA
VTQPVLRQVGSHARLVDFGADPPDIAHARVLALDAGLAADPPPGVEEWVPAISSLMVVHDPLQADLDALDTWLLAAATRPEIAPLQPATHELPVCYEGDFGPDLGAAAAQLGLAPDDLADRHAAAPLHVLMYGFAPGYAYLGGVPDALHLPRKPSVVRRRPTGSVMIAAAQCIVTTLPMPTGWWVIGHSPATILDPHAARPFRFDPGDIIRFRRIDADEHRRLCA